MTKFDQIEQILKNVNPEFKLIKEVQEDGSIMAIGPFPSVIFLIDQKENPDGYIVSVNADAPNAVFFITEVMKTFPDLVHYGPYAEDLDGNTIIGGGEAYQRKEQFILDAAAQILSSRKLAQAEKGPELIVPEQKIVLA